MPWPFAERPAFLVADRVHNRHADDIFELLELSHNDRPMCPGTGPGSVEMVATARRWITGAPVSGHPTLKDIRLPGKGALDALLVWKLCLNGHCGAPAFLYRIILRSDKEDGRGGLVSSLCSRNARSQKGETGSLAISCSRNAHARKVLVRRAHSGIDQAPLENQKGELGRRAQWKINQSLSLKRQ